MIVSLNQYLDLSLQTVEIMSHGFNQLAPSGLKNWWHQEVSWSTENWNSWAVTKALNNKISPRGKVKGHQAMIYELVLQVHIDKSRPPGTMELTRWCQKVCSWDLIAKLGLQRPSRPSPFGFKNLTPWLAGRQDGFETSLSLPSFRLAPP